MLIKLEQVNLVTETQGVQLLTEWGTKSSHPSYPCEMPPCLWSVSVSVCLLWQKTKVKILQFGIYTIKSYNKYNIRKSVNMGHSLES